MEEAFEAIVDGVQAIDVSVGPVAGTWRVMVAVGLWLPRVVVTVPVCVVEDVPIVAEIVALFCVVDVKVPVVAEKAALLCPESTVTLEGTVRAGLLLCNETRVLDVTA